MAKKRTEAERRTRQGERLAKLLRLVQLISGAGRWDAEALAKELEVSSRTVHRLLQTLTYASIPWRFDPQERAYRIPRSFRLTLVDHDPSEKQLAKTECHRCAKVLVELSELALRADSLTCEIRRVERRLQAKA